MMDEKDKIIKDVETGLQKLDLPSLDICVFGRIRCHIFITCKDYHDAMQWKPVLEEFTNKAKIYYSKDNNGNNVTKVNATIG